MKTRTRLLTAAVAALLVLTLSAGTLYAKGGAKTGNIEGVVLGPNGPVGGATVMLFGGGGFDQAAETYTAADGTFEFTRILPGDYYVSVFSWQPPCHGGAPVTVVARQTAYVTVELDCVE
jgi:hypothetical protein